MLKNRPQVIPPQHARFVAGSGGLGPKWTRNLDHTIQIIPLLQQNT
jgi:hypothetical protein